MVEDPFLQKIRVAKYRLYMHVLQHVYIYIYSIKKNSINVKYISVGMGA